MATLNILNNFQMLRDGLAFSGKQGLAASGAFDPLAITVDGNCYVLPGQLPTATVRTLWDEGANFPVDFDYLFLWASDIAYVQLIGQTTSVIHRLAATQPFVLPGYDAILPAASVALMDGGVEPTLEDIDSIALGNYTGATIDYFLFLVD